MITRVVRGIPDEAPNGFLAYDASRTTFGNGQTDYTYLKGLADGKRDGLPDTYYYNIGGMTGQFVFGNDGKPRPIPYSPVQIKADLPLVNDQGVTVNRGIQIVTPAGTRYIFEQAEEASVMIGGQTTTFFSSWYLTRVLSADGTDAITLTYQSHPLTYSAGISEQSKYAISSKSFTSLHCANVKISLVKAKKLSKIAFAGGEVEFTTSNEREDVTGDKRLTGITVRSVLNGETRTLRQWSFQYSYFQSLIAPVLPCPGAITDAERVESMKRLRLDAVTESNNGLSLPPYRFSYAATPLPSTFSTAQDHWGYYNGATTTGNTEPNSYIDGIYYGTTYEDFMILSNGDRESNDAYQGAGMLTRIDLPTGGSTQYTFEPHLINTNVEQGSIGELTQYANAGGGSGVPLTKTISFTIPVDAANATIPAFFYGTLTKVEAGLEDGLVYLKEVGSTTNLADLTGAKHSSVVKSAVVTLHRGKSYELYARSDGDPLRASVSLRYVLDTRRTVPGVRTTGGMRIRQVTSYDPVQKISSTSRYTYQSEIDPVRSSGYVTAGYPIGAYLGGYYARQVTRTFTLPTACTPTSENFILLQANPIHAPGNGGSAVNYRYVTVYGEEEGAPQKQGKTVYEYSGADVLPSPPPPLPPLVQECFKCGWLLSERQFRYVNNQYRLHQEVVNAAPEASMQNLTEIKGLQATYQASYTLNECTPTYSIAPFVHQPFSTKAEWLFSKSTTEKLYAEDGVTVQGQSTVNYFFANPAHAQLTRLERQQSNGGILITENRYPGDAGYTAGAAATLLAQNQLAGPLEVRVLEQMGTDAPRLLNASRTRFTDQGPGSLDASLRRVYPDRMEGVDLTRPVTGDLDSWLISNYREQSRIDNFDGLGNPLTSTGRGDVRASFLYGYGGRYAVAQVGNAAQNQIAYTSFEEAATGSWVLSGGSVSSTDGRTGRKSFSGSLSRSGLPAGLYTVSYWSKGSLSVTVPGGRLVSSQTGVNGWNYSEWEINTTGSVSVQNGGNLLDEVRLHPADSRMVTSTYDVLVGKTSVTDANQVTTYFFYDDLGRLQSVKDQNGNLVDHTQYVTREY